MTIAILDIVGSSLNKLFKNKNIFVFAIIGALISTAGSFSITAQSRAFASLFNVQNPPSIGVLLPALLSLMSSVGLIFIVLALIDVFIVAAIMVSVGSGRAKISMVSKEAVSRYLTFLFTSIVVGIIVVIGFILLIVPGIFLAIKLSIAGTESVVGKKDVVESLKSSWEKTNGNFWHILATFVILFLIVAIITGIISAIVSAIGVQFLSSLFSTFFGFSFTIMTVLIYQSLSRPKARTRRRKPAK